MGVNVCLEYQRTHPEKVLGMILISGTVAPPQDNMFFSNISDLTFPLVPKLMNINKDLFHKLWTNSHRLKLINWVVKRGGFNPSKTTTEFVSTYLQKIGELPEELFFKLLSEMESHDVIADLSKVKCPTMIMGGDKDQIVPLSCQQNMHDLIPDSFLYIIHEGSHVPQVDFPETINEAMLYFLRRFHFKLIEA
jgi:pimeloyl-ACP methyl ester carboxylesterase